MEKSNKNNTVIVMSATAGYSYTGFVSEGYRVFVAYKKVSTVLRVLRELCFRVPFMPKKIWYDQEILRINPKYIIIRDAIITRNYLEWLKEHFPKVQMNFLYENMIGKARHLIPEKIPDGIRIWTYDSYDSEKYNIRLKRTSCYFPYYVKEKKRVKYDILFVGRDKGRGKMLLDLKEYLEEKGLKTKFVITSNGKFAKKKKYYQSEVPYEQIATWVSESRSVLNVVMENQHGITVRDMECLFNKVKLITTNKNIKQAEFYNDNNIYILDDNNWDGLLGFIKSEYDDTKETDLNKCSAEMMIEEITKD